MTICKFDIDNFEYNIESNLAAMGLPFPKSVFSASTSIAAGIASIDISLSAKGNVPLSAIGKGGSLSNKFVAVSAAAYAGAVIGSAFMAANRATRCTIPDLENAARGMGLSTWWISDAVNENSEILRKQ
ncbi:hypothetical protein [Aliivibrio fischeri]|nr:hypothetical protein [Aliivibrio fischeri]MUK51229.1 hypothetical protein [Aliivibrio fischeri]